MTALELFFTVCGAAVLTRALMALVELLET